MLENTDNTKSLLGTCPFAIVCARLRWQHVCADVLGGGGSGSGARRKPTGRPATGGTGRRGHLDLGSLAFHPAQPLTIGM